MLVPNWKKVVRHAWSFRLNVIAGIFSFLEFMLWIIPDWFPDIPRGPFAMVSFAVIVVSNIMKVISQKEFRDE
jgi:hypothetical protein